jgi:hypothetical protein
VGPRKQAFAALAVLALAGCSGGGERDGKRVSGRGYSFVAPAGWHVKRTSRETAAEKRSALVSVTVLPLVRPYTPVLFSKVAAELDDVAQKLAAASKGRVDESRTVTIAGRRARRYELSFVQNGHETVERLAFVLVGRREYQLLCRFRRGESDSPCEQLLATFALA